MQVFLFLTFEFKKGRSLWAALSAHTAQALARGPVSAPIANAGYAYIDCKSAPSKATGPFNINL
jgi:hypothetical protein